MADLRISDLTTATSVNDTDLVEISQVDGNSSSGYATKKTTILAIAIKILKGISFSDLATTSKQIINAINELKNGKVDASQIGTAGGVAELDSSGHVPASQLPSSVDDIVEGYYYNEKFYEEDTHQTEIPAEAGKIYIDLTTNNTYRWGGSVYVEISPSLSLGETSTTAYRGDRGKVAYDHATESGRETTGVNQGLYKFSVTPEGHIGAGPTAATKSDFTAMGLLGEIDDALSSTSENPVKNNALYTAFQGKENKSDMDDDVTDIVVGLTDTQTATGNPVTITTVQDGLAKSAVVEFSPTQDLHGYDNPWPAGGGKNKLPFDLDTIKANNTEGTWSGNNYTYNGVTWTVNDDGTYIANGTATNNLSVIVIIGKATSSSSKVWLSFPSTDYKITTGFTTDGTSSTYEIGYRPANVGSVRHIYNNDGHALVSTDINLIQVVVREGYTANNLKFEPMIVSSTESDYTFISYSNICPISGWDSLVLNQCGKNLVYKTINDVYIDSTGVIKTDTGNQYYVFIAYVIQNEKYTISSKMTNNNITWAFYTSEPQLDSVSYNNSRGVGNTDTFTVTAPISGWLVVRCDKSFTKPQVEKGEIQTDFSPIGQTHTATFPDTVYGGKVVWKDGVVKAVIDKAIKNIGNIIWSRSTSYTNPFFYSNNQSGIKENTAIISEDYGFYGINTASNFGNNATNGQCGITANGLQIFVRDDSFTDANIFKTTMSDVKIVYELATPQEITLTPEIIALLKGNNILWTDGDNVIINYAKLPHGNLGVLVDYIQQLEARVKVLEEA